MYDIHCHLLPGIDDGAVNMEEAVDMARAASQMGIESIIATPHYVEGITGGNLLHNQQTLAALNGELARMGINTRIFLGNEVRVTPNVLNLLNSKEISTLNGSRYILLELPVYDIPIFLESLIYTMRVKGLVPIIAHPERNYEIMQNPGILHGLIGRGCLAQLNISSMKGKYGAKVRKTARTILEYDMVHFIATDAHSAKDFLCAVSKGLVTVEKLTDSDKFDRLSIVNPRMVFEDKSIG